MPGRQLQPVERALARQGAAPILSATSILTGGIGYLTEHGKQRVLAQGVVIVEVFKAQRQPHHPLLDQRLHGVFDLISVPVIDKTAGLAFQNMCALLDLAQRQPATVGTDRAAIKFAHDNAASQSVKFQLTCSTLCLHKAAGSFGCNYLLAQALCHGARPI